MGSAEGIRELVEPAVAAAGLELWDVEVSRTLVRVLIDRPGGIDLDSLAGVANRVVSPLLDEHPELTPPGRFQLEVSSPGVERTLRTPEQFRRYIGQQITVKTTVPIEGSRRHNGILTSVSEGSIGLNPGGVAESSIEIPMGDVDRARTVLVWGPSTADSTSRPRKRPAAARRAGATTANDSKDSAL
jgi:ribosome maturation factor RimP